jgi:hypothetical protein
MRKLPGRSSVWGGLACWGALVGGCGGALLGPVFALIGAAVGFWVVLIAGGILCSIPDEKD